MPRIVLEKVTKFYSTDMAVRAGVENVDLTIEQGEFVFLIGSRGAGKTTLLNLITGETKPSSGAVCLGDRNLRRMSLWERRRVNKLYGRVWQDSHLIRRRTIGENLEVMAKSTARRKETPTQRRERIQKVLALVGMSGVENCYPVELSYGECRRVELAGALINSPSILVLDEVTDKLGDDATWDILQLLNEINRKGTTVIMATHASQYVNIMHRRVVTIVDGHVYSDVKTEDTGLDAVSAMERPGSMDRFLTNCKKNKE